MSTDELSAVTISYHTLLSDPASLEAALSEGFGSSPDSLGIVVIKDLPKEYTVRRDRLLRLANSFAELPPEIRDRYADAASSWSFGWSHGKEIMNGKPDTLKGSYYANPLADQPKVTDAQKSEFPEYYGTNIWPDSQTGVEDFEEAFKSLGSFIYDVGIALAKACQPFAGPHLVDKAVSLADLVSPQTTKARLLHYFPPSPKDPHTLDDEPVDSWCGFHLDHSLITGLCSAMYLAHEDGKQPMVVLPPSPTSGLYIKTRGGQLCKVSIPPDCLAFQTGEALELATDGRLRATPHCVRVGGISAGQVTRETFALFMQPDTHTKLGAKETFGQFSKRIFSKHYENGNVTAAA